MNNLEKISNFSTRGGKKLKAFSSTFQFLKEKNDVQSLIWFG